MSGCWEGIGCKEEWENIFQSDGNFPYHDSDDLYTSIYVETYLTVSLELIHSFLYKLYFDKAKNKVLN